MNDIDYDEVTPKMEDYLLGASKYNQRWERSTYETASDTTHVDVLNEDNWKPNFYVGFRGPGEKCWTFEIPYIFGESYSAYTLQINNTIFPNGIRPETIGENAFGLRVYFHYPKQLLKASIGRRTWASHDHPNINPKRYSMVFHMHQVEILEQRNKKESPCIDLIEDDRLMQEHIDNVGCKPTHWKQNTSIPKCTTKEQMKEFLIDFKTSKYLPTCKTMQKLLYAYEEFNELQDYLMKDIVVKDNSTAVCEVAIYFQDNIYLEIEQTREYTMYSLIGEAGGYVGLFLGYAILQLPGLLCQLLGWLKRKLISHRCCSCTERHCCKK